MATILVDYENVKAHGLKGDNYLCKHDSLYIFYSKGCAKIPAENIKNIINSGCQFFIQELVNTGKNALDFYIACQTGECIGKYNEKYVVIVSGDKGFASVVDFWSEKNDDTRRYQVITASNIEKGLMCLSDVEGKERRKIIHNKTKLLDLRQEYEKYQEELNLEIKVKELFCGTEHNDKLADIILYIKESMSGSKKIIYNEALHRFGRKNGTEIYRIIKELL